MTKPEKNVSDMLLDLSVIYRHMPDLPHPNIDNESVTLNFWSFLYDSPEECLQAIRDAARKIGGRWHKNDPNNGEIDRSYYILTNDRLLGGYKLRLLSQRNTVCTPVQVGTRRVVIESREAEIKDVPVYEYECKPLMADIDRDAVGAPSKELEE